MKHTKRVFLTVFVVMGYILGFMLGFFVILYSPIIQHADNLKSGLSDSITAYDANGVLPSLSPTTTMLIFDANGSCENGIHDGANESYHRYIPLAYSRLSQVLAGEEVFTPFVRGLSIELFPKKIPDNFASRGVKLLIGKPYTTASGELKAVFLIKDFIDLEPSMSGYLAMFTVLYFIIVLFLYVLGRKNRQITRLNEEYVANISHD